MDAGDFRTLQPAFSSATAYPNATITRWLGVAALMLDATRYGQLYDFATGLFVAHNLALEDRARRPGGASTGVQTGKTIGKVSVTYDPTIGLNAGAGHWNLTVYGIQFWQLQQVAGIGGMQIGTPLPGDVSGRVW